MASRKTDIRKDEPHARLMHAKVRDWGCGFADRDELHLQTAPQVPARPIHRFMQPLLASSWEKKVPQGGHEEGLHSFPASTTIHDCRSTVRRFPDLGLFQLGLGTALLLGHLERC